MWTYSHASLEQQLGQYGVRSLELDVSADPAGGLYRKRAGPKLAAIVLGDRSDLDTQALGPLELDLPGWKLVHLPDFDFNSNCQSLSACLTQVQAWRKQQPRHAPLFIHLEVKTWRAADVLPADALSNINSVLASQPTLPGPDALTEPLRLGAFDLASLDAEVLSVVPRDQIFTPDDMRAAAGVAAGTPLRELLEPRNGSAAGWGWPEVSAVEGKLVFIVLASAATQYLQLHGGDLRGAPFFVEARGGASQPVSASSLNPNVVFLNAADSVLQGSTLEAWDAQVAAAAAVASAWVQQGYIVRAPVDPPPVNQLNSSASDSKDGVACFYPNRAQQLMAAGVQLVHTDCPGWYACASSSTGWQAGPRAGQCSVRLAGRRLAADTFAVCLTAAGSECLTLEESALLLPPPSPVQSGTGDDGRWRYNGTAAGCDSNPAAAAGCPSPDNGSSSNRRPFIVLGAVGGIVVAVLAAVVISRKVIMRRWQQLEAEAGHC